MSSQPPAKQHDAAYRELFTHPELIEDLLRHFVHEPWVEELDFSTLRRESEISVVRRRGLKIRDVVWSVDFRDRKLYILVLLEFQSRPDPIMAIRQVIYTVSLYEDLYKQKRLTEGGKLPPVLPIVLYKGQARWRAPLSIEDMIAPAPETLARYLPRMSYFLIDEQRTPVSLTTEERNTVAALLALEQSREGAEVLEVVCLLVQSLREPGDESLRQAFKELVLKALPVKYAPIAEVFDHPEDAMTLAQRLKLSDDRKQAAVRADVQRSVLVSLLEQKFGPLDEVSAARLTRAKPTQLGKWILRVLPANSLDEVWS